MVPSNFGKNVKYCLTQASNSTDLPVSLCPNRKDCKNNNNSKKRVEKLVYYFSCNIPVLSKTSARKLPEEEGTFCLQQTLYLRYK